MKCAGAQGEEERKQETRDEEGRERRRGNGIDTENCSTGLAQVELSSVNRPLRPGHSLFSPASGPEAQMFIFDVNISALRKSGSRTISDSTVLSETMIVGKIVVQHSSGTPPNVGIHELAGDYCEGKRLHEGAMDTHRGYLISTPILIYHQLPIHSQ